MSKSRKPNKNQHEPRRRGKVRLYTLEIGLVRGSIPSTSPNDSSRLFRTIQIRGDQMLADLHRAINDAFERSTDDSYEFQFDAGPLHPEGKRYLVPGAFEIAIETRTPAAGCVTETTIDALGLQVGQHFVYSPDEEEDWWYPITVQHIAEIVPRGKYPKITKRAGKSPFEFLHPERPAVEIGKDEGADTACLVAEHHWHQKDFHKAVEAYSRAIESNPTVDAYEGRAKAYRALADADERAAQRLRQQ